jgi:hypothetical protein
MGLLGLSKKPGTYRSCARYEHARRVFLVPIVSGCFIFVVDYEGGAQHWNLRGTPQHLSRNCLSAQGQILVLHFAPRYVVRRRAPRAEIIIVNTL